MSTPPVLFFPDLSQSISYADALRFCQLTLGTLPHGASKHWAQEQGINYTMLVNLKNGRVPKQVPHLVQRLLLAWGLPTQLFRHGKETMLQFEQAADLVRVREMLSQQPV